MLIVCDFDGTVTERDTNSHLARKFAPEASNSVEGRLATRQLSVRDVLGTEFAAIDVGIERVVTEALTIAFRPGFEQLVTRARASGGDVVLVSSGFRQVIEPMLERDGLLGQVQLLANDVELDDDGGHIRWRDLPMCARCGEHCKRHDVAALRAGALHDGRSFDEVAFVGDGYSDRCGAEGADRIFARDSLAAWLDDQGVSFEPWGDFHDVASALGLDMELAR